jgi:hypothetical protein
MQQVLNSINIPKLLGSVDNAHKVVIKRQKIILTCLGLPYQQIYSYILSAETGLDLSLKDIV